MVNKTYDKIKKFIKTNYKIFIIYIGIFCLFFIKIPYYISRPGGLIDTAEKIKTTDNFKLKGSLNMAYVAEMQASIPMYIYSLFNKDWQAYYEKEIVNENENIKDLEYRNNMLLKEGNSIAELVAYKNSNIDYEVKNNKVYVTYIDELAKTDLKIKDQIIKVDGNDVVDKNYLFSYIKSKNINDKIKFTVIENKKEKTKTAKLIDIEGEPKVGAMIAETFDIKSKNKVKLNFDESESGSSGGLISALTIYSNINKIDLTNGKKISGTGTIDIDGNVGEISGVKYKLIGAEREKADVFLVPKENYKEAKKIKNERGYKIDVILVETFEQALKYLKN